MGFKLDVVSLHWFSIVLEVMLLQGPVSTGTVFK
jgi:hypothetical protein